MSLSVRFHKTWRFDMLKKCVVCDVEFEIFTTTKVCSNECRAIRKRISKREEQRRYHARNPHKKKEQRLRYEDKYPEKLAAQRESDRIRRKRLRNALAEERDRKAFLDRLKPCVECGEIFEAMTSTNTCSDDCWIENRKRVRRRPETKTDKNLYLQKKRNQQNVLNRKRSAALELIREIEEKGLGAIL